MGIQMADLTNPLQNKKSLYMDMVPPFAVYVDNKKVTDHATEEEAEELYAQLRVTHLGKAN
jgi:hypothetical protein